MSNIIFRLRLSALMFAQIWKINYNISQLREIMTQDDFFGVKYLQEPKVKITTLYKFTK